MGKNWKTTVAALGVAGLYAWEHASGDWKQQLIAVGIAIFGALCSDFNVPGSAAK